MITSKFNLQPFCRAFLTTLALIWIGAASLSAQTSTGNLRGVVTGTGGAPMANAAVTARDLETNQTRGTMTNSDGAYYLGGLRPASYEVQVRRIGQEPQTRQIRLLIGQTLDLNFSLTEAPVTLSSVQITALPAQAEKHTSEVATNVTQEQINRFADATGDHQWIHVDAARAAVESPFKTTIAHGFLTLSLVSTLLRTAINPTGMRSA